MLNGSGGGLDLGVEIGDDILAGRDGGLDRRDPYQLLEADGADMALKRDHHVAAQFLELDQRQTVIGQHSHRGHPVLQKVRRPDS